MFVIGVFIYGRVSSRDQEKHKTHISQKDLLLEAVKKDNKTVDEEFWDLAKSGGLEQDIDPFDEDQVFNRPGLRHLLDRLVDEPESILYIEDQSRLSRSVIQFAIMMNIFQKSSTKLVGVAQPINLETPEGKLVAGIINEVNEYQKYITRMKVRRGVHFKMKGLKEEGKNWGPQQKFSDKDFQKYYKQGQNKTELANQLKVSWQTINRYCKKNEIEIPYKGGI